MSRQTNIVGNYYILDQGNGRNGISYKVDGGYIDRNPMHSRVLRYAICDSLLVMELEYSSNELEYYAINMNKDGSFAESASYEVLQVPADAYPTSSLASLKPVFITVEN